MADIEHLNIAEAQLHNPKGFSTAGNSTVPFKNSGGTLEWINPQEISPIAVHCMGYVENNVTPLSFGAANVFVQAGATFNIYDCEGFNDQAGNPVSGGGTASAIEIITAGDYMIDGHWSALGGAGGGTSNFQIAFGVKPSGGSYPTIVGADTTRGNLTRALGAGTLGAWGYTGMLTNLSVGDQVTVLVMNKTDTRQITLTDVSARLFLNKAT